MKLTAPRLMIGPPADTADIRYLSGFSAVDAMILLDGPAGRILVVPDLEVGRARAESKGVRVFGFSEIAAGQRKSLFETVSLLLHAKRVRRVMVSPWFPVGAARFLQEHGVHVDITAGPLVPERMVKKKNEIGRLIEVQRVAVRAMKRAIEQIRAAEIGPDGTLRKGRRPLYSEDVRDEIEHTASKYGCQCTETIVAGGKQAVNPHERGSGPLRAGEAIVLDIFPRHQKSGYWGDLTRTVVRGRPSEALRQMHRAVRRAQQAALACIRHGAEAAEPDRAARRTFEALGFVTKREAGKSEGFIHGTGHGLGLEIHEMPSLREGGGTLHAGHIVTVEPGLYYPNIGGVRIEDVVRVTLNGYWLFPAPPRRFELA